MKFRIRINIACKLMMWETVKVREYIDAIYILRRLQNRILCCISRKSTRTGSLIDETPPCFTLVFAHARTYDRILL